MARIAEKTVKFDEVAFLPRLGDSAAIAKDVLQPGTVILFQPSEHESTEIFISVPVLEGHRFAVRFVASGTLLLSWGLPFGEALVDLPPGTPLLNANMHSAIAGRVSLLPRATDESASDLSALIVKLLESTTVNFKDIDVSAERPFTLDPKSVGVGVPNEVRRARIDPSTLRCGGIDSSSFLGFPRAEISRGVGVRNHVLLMGMSSLTAPTAQRLEFSVRRWPGLPSEFCDGIRVVAHTEGEAEVQNNLVLLFRCVCGFISHGNIGAAVLLFSGMERHLTPASILEFALSHGYPESCFREPHLQFVCIGDENSLSESPGGLIQCALAKAVVTASGFRRIPCSLSALNIALQCGGSDAFSGITGNCLAGDVAERLIEVCGAKANLAESPELIGAEPYILEHVASLSVAEKFITATERYKQYAARHNQTAQGNPSGGNLFRGLYNISLKSLGAARKKPPTTALDAVLEYGEPMDLSKVGQYVFMDSPGNDLESIAGQVACGCNIIFFITGNGSMTNFPFVPTLKIVTTTSRFQLLRNEMDVDAGPYGCGGSDRERVVADTTRLTVEIASGRLTKGELANHSQVSIWRNWVHAEHPVGSTAPQREGPNVIKGSLFSQAEPLRVREVSVSLPRQERTRGRGLLPVFSIVPTSICSSEVARMLVHEFQEERFLNCRWISPAHTEGCGNAGDPAWDGMYQRLILSFATHESVCHALFLEHGCEKTHNDYFSRVLTDNGLKLESFGFLSVQKDGGIDSVRQKIRAWFSSKRMEIFNKPVAKQSTYVGIMVHPSCLKIGGTSNKAAEVVSEFFKNVASLIFILTSSLQIGVAVTTASPLIQGSHYSRELVADVLVDGVALSPTMLAGQQCGSSAVGLHLMAVPSNVTWDEEMTCLAPCCALIVVIADTARRLKLLPGSHLVQTVRRCAAPTADWAPSLAEDLDKVLTTALNEPQELTGECSFCVPRGNAVSM